jgi:hypothetical protein
VLSAFLKYVGEEITAGGNDVIMGDFITESFLQGFPYVIRLV